MNYRVWKMVNSSCANNHYVVIKHKLMCITSKLQIKQSNVISNPTFEKSHIYSNLYILQNRLNRCFQRIPVKDYIFFDIRHKRIY